MSEMVERVKKAITGITGEHYGDYDERIARAAIEAMRIGLTKAMMEAGCEAYANGNPDEYPSPSGMEAAFEAMISAALKD